MSYIRTIYNVPAKRGGMVKYRGLLGKITGASGPYLLIRLHGEKRSGRYHPTWELQYL